MRVLIVSFLFAPSNDVGSIRVSKTAKYLVQLGHEVRIVTARNTNHSELLPVEIPEANVVYVNWRDINRWLRGATHGHASASHMGTAQNRGKRWLRLTETFGRLYRFVTNFPDSRVGWISSAVSAGVELVKEWGPDLVFGSGYPWSSLVAGKAIARRTGLPFVAELRDLWTDNHYTRSYPVRQWFERRLESRVLRDTAGIVTVSEPLAEVLRLRFGRPTCVVLNGFEPAAGIQEVSSPNAEQLRIVYTGNVYPGAQDPTPLFEAIKSLGSLGRKIRVEFYGTNPDHIRDCANRVGLATPVLVTPSLPHIETMKIQSGADLLLLLCWNRAYDGVLPAKMFEYIGARRPILCVGRESDSAARFVVNRMAGVATAQATEISGLLRKWLKEKEEFGELARVSQLASQGLSRQDQTSVLADFLSEVIQRNSHRVAS